MPEPHIAEEQWITVAFCRWGCGNKLQKMRGQPARWYTGSHRCDCEPAGIELLPMDIAELMEEKE